MRGLAPVRILVPGTGGSYRCGGLSVALQTARLISSLRPTELVTYRQKQSEYAFLDDLLRACPASEDKSLWLVSWGFDVPKLIKRLRDRYVAYQAHSAGYGFELTSKIPIIAVSRNTLGYWGNWAPRSPLFLVPNALQPQWLERGARHDTASPRPMDVLVQARKSSAYLRNFLVPALRSRGLKVHVQAGWVDDVVGLFNQSTVYLYDSADYWRCRGVSEGFGLPPLEALACGCAVFSSMNHALADLLTPGTVAHQIGQGSLSRDVERIVAAVACPADWLPPSDVLDRLLDQSSERACTERWCEVLSELDALLPSLLNPETQEAVPLQTLPLWRLRAADRWSRLRTGFHRVVNRLAG